MPGERAGLAGGEWGAGEWAAREHDVFLARPRGRRNQVWETDPMQAPVPADVEGKARRPWITWFTDRATNAVTGVAVTPGDPSRESVHAALRSTVPRPFGRVPEKVRVDRGRDFLSRTVTAAFDLLDVTPLAGLEPDPFPELPSLGGQLGALRVPHTTGLPKGSPPVTSRTTPRRDQWASTVARRVSDASSSPAATTGCRTRCAGCVTAAQS